MSQLSRVGKMMKELHAETDPPANLSPERARRDKAMSMETMIGAVDAAIGRDNDGSDATYYAASTFAVVWAAIGYVLWIMLVLSFRVLVATGRFVAHLFRRKETPR